MCTLRIPTKRLLHSAYLSPQLADAQTGLSDCADNKDNVPLYLSSFTGTNTWYLLKAIHARGGLLPASIHVHSAGMALVG